MAITWGMAQNRKTSTFFSLLMYSRLSTPWDRAMVMRWFMQLTAESRFSGCRNASRVLPYLLHTHLGQNMRGAGSSTMSSR